MNFLRALLAIQIAGLMITIPALAYLQSSMISEVNRTGRYAPVRPKWHLGLAQSGELEHVYGQLFPDRWKLDIFRVIRQLSILMGGVTALLITTQKFLHMYLLQHSQP